MIETTTPIWVKGTVVTILCDRGDRYFAPMKWEKRYLW